MSSNSLLLEAIQFTSLRNNKAVFKAIDLEVKSGECHQLLGANGAGKSSCLLALAGLISGTNIRLTSSISYLGHSNNLYQNLTVLETYNYWQIHTRFLTVKCSLLPDNSLVKNLSSGQKRYLAWQRLKYEANSIWLLDEPLANLDQIFRTKVLQDAKDHLTNNGAIIIASHTDYWSELITHRHEISGPTAEDFYE